MRNEKTHIRNISVMWVIMTEKNLVETASNLNTDAIFFNVFELDKVNHVIYFVI